ncbi:MAG TPA: hypothetical protein VKV40_21400 [Ktedonobacteraceae bacterium]|nr:hypothetical protein [Ktedonobacteraceae bacterium]
MPALQRLQTGYRVRNPTQDDIPGIIDLIYEHELTEVGKTHRYEPGDTRRNCAPARICWRDRGCYT